MKNFFLYAILWLSGCIIAAIIIIMWNAPFKSKDVVSLFGSNAPELTSNNESGNIVNELLLSASELNIFGENNLIGLNNKNNSNSFAGILLSREIKSNPENAYRRILKQKLEKINTFSGGRDFYIKAVPK